MKTKGHKTILLVEDEAILAMVGKITVEEFGYKVVNADTGEKAVEIFEKTPEIDLVLMDINLGSGIDGTEAARQILSKRHIPIVFLTSHQEKEYVDKVKQITRYGYVIKNSGNFVLQTSIETAFELFEAGKTAKANELRFKSIIDASPIPYALNDEELNITYLNSAFINTFGYDMTDIPTVAAWFPKAYPNPEYLECVKKSWIDRLDKAKRTGKPFEEMELSIRCKNGETKIVLGCAAALEDSFKNEHLVTFFDITERKKTEDNLLANETRYRSIVENCNEGIAITDSEGRILDLNDNICRMLGYNREELLGDNVRKIDSDENRKKFAERVKLLHANNSIVFEGAHIRKDGSAVPTEVSVKLVTKDKGGFMQAFIRDATERKKAEEKIQKLLNEKELLLKEVHHRIKNNMSIISGLLMLQAASLKDQLAINALNDAQSRLQSMSVLYNKLYRSENFNEISLKEYLEKLVDELFFTLINANHISAEKNIEDITICTKTSFYLGILINELLTNIAKYAFLDGEKGLVKVSAAKKNDKLVIVVHDDGVGMPESVRVSGSKGFGLTLVDMMVNQLNGTIQIENHNGTKFTIEFPLI